MENIKISIVIPVYNGEKFIKKCLKSVLTQTYRNIEVVIVNDGSKDNTLEICNSFAAADARIKVISHSNCGSAKSRRVGIENTIGDYVTFVDSDDFYCKKDAIETMARYISQHKVDVLQFKNETKYHFLKRTPKSNDCVEVVGRDDFMTNHYPKLLGAYYDGSYLSVAIWDKVYRRELFDNLPKMADAENFFVGDDLHLNLHILENINSICFIPNVLYTYRVLTGGVSKYKPSYMADYQIVKYNQLHFISKYKDQYQWKQDMEYFCHSETAWCVYARGLEVAKYFKGDDALAEIQKNFDYDWVRCAIEYFKTTEIKDTYEPTLQKIRMLLEGNPLEYYSKAIEVNKKRRFKEFVKKFL